MQIRAEYSFKKAFLFTGIFATQRYTSRLWMTIVFLLVKNRAFMENVARHNLRSRLVSEFSALAKQWLWS